MTIGKKVLNGFGIFFGIILSIVLVLNLIVAPLVLSTLSMVTPKTLTKALTSIDVSQFLDIDEQDQESQAVSALLSSNAAKKVIELYAADVINSLSAKPGEAQLTADVFKGIIEENIDEIVNVVKLTSADSEITDEEIKQQIQESLSNNAEEIFASLPKPEEVATQLTTENAELKTALGIIGNAKKIKAGIIGTLVFLAALVFVCRLYKFKGVRWLSVDLFVASGVLILVCAGLSIGSGTVQGLLQGEAAAAVVFETVMSSLTKGMFIRTAVMLLVAIALMVASVFIKKAINKKAISQEVIPVQEIPVEVEAPEEQPVETIDTI